MMEENQQSRDPFAQAGTADLAALDAIRSQPAQQQAACNAAMGQQLGIYQPGYPTYEAQMRLTCLQMALYVADGAPPLPVAEVIERARAYWRFVQLGE